MFISDKGNRLNGLIEEHRFRSAEAFSAGGMKSVLLCFSCCRIFFPLHILFNEQNRMTMRSFASDNNSGVHPLVMEALNRANSDHAVGYGDDPWTEEAVCK